MVGFVRPWWSWKGSGIVSGDATSGRGDVTAAVGDVRRLVDVAFQVGIEYGIAMEDQQRAQAELKGGAVGGVS